jgi:plasmid stabilization system protein ParE
LKRSVRLLPRALHDLARLEDFLATKSPRAASRAAEALSRAVLSLGDYSERGRMISESGIRELAVQFGRDGYVIQYRVDEQTVLVARIFHAREGRTPAPQRQP